MGSGETGIELSGNLLVGGRDRAGGDLPTRSTVVWSGGLGSSAFDAHPGTWLPRGWEALMEASQDAPAGTLVRPHAAHVISDGLACRRFLEQPEAAHLGLAFSPASMLTEAMLSDRQDHLTRLFEMVAAEASLILLEDLAQGRPCVAGRGSLNGGQIARLLDLHAPVDVRVVVAADADEAALRWLQ